MNGQIWAPGVAVVTGAAGGMGSATARRLAEVGRPELLLCDVEASRIDAVAAPLREAGVKVDVLAGDVADPAFPSRVVAALRERPISLLVHAAGISPSMGTPERIMEVNLNATQRLVDAVREHMARGSAAVLIASNSAYFPLPSEVAAAFAGSSPDNAEATYLTSRPVIAYMLSKRGVVALVKRQAKSFGARGARLISISPGATDTNMFRTEEKLFGKGERQVIESAAIPRTGQPDEIAAVAVFLCSPAASFVTACDVLVDGGEVAAAAV